MKNLLIIFSISAVALSGCMMSSQSQESVMVQQEEYKGPVCGEIDGEKQTFPSLEELSNIPNAYYLHDRPCYGE